MTNPIVDLEFRYYVLKEKKTNKDWDMSLWDFLISKGITPNEIRHYLRSPTMRTNKK